MSLVLLRNGSDRWHPQSLDAPEAKVACKVINIMTVLGMPLANHTDAC